MVNEEDQMRGWLKNEKKREKKRKDKQRKEPHNF